MILATPIFYPAVLKLGFNPLWFGIVIGVVVMIGVVIPPVAVCVFVVKNITKEPMGRIYRASCPSCSLSSWCGASCSFFPSSRSGFPRCFTNRSRAGVGGEAYCETCFRSLRISGYMRALQT